MTPQRWDGVDARDMVALEQIDTDLFRNVVAQRNVNNALFGGQVMGLSLMAASRTAGDRIAHSMHGYFLSPGSIEQPVLLAVERTRDGGSFTTRRVVARQNDRPVFHLECSFQKVEEGFDHASPFPDDVGAPEDCLEMTEFVVRNADRLNGHIIHRFSKVQAVELRPVEPERYIFGGASVARRRMWVRVPSAGPSRDPTEHTCLLAYLSDYWLASTAALPHAAWAPSPAIYMASLNHAMWFHRQARVDDWLLLDCDSPSAQSGRGFARGTIYDRDKRLVASVAQEAVLRRRHA
jgi:acyl-CoA thioesterase-2